MNRIISLLTLAIIVLSCSDSKYKNEIDALRTELDSLKITSAKSENNTKGEIATFLTFQGNNAEEAMNFYIELFDNSEIIKVQRWAEGGPVEKGKIMHATFSLNGNLFMCSDSPPVHDWGFTPAVSNYIECENENKLQNLFLKLSENGKVMMPPNNYGFSTKFAFVEDRFGVSWQLNLK